jgi:hypothetical protein
MDNDKKKEIGKSEREPKERIVHGVRIVDYGKGPFTGPCHGKGGGKGGGRGKKTWKILD